MRWYRSSYELHGLPHHLSRKKTGHFPKFSCAHSEFSSPEASSQSHPHSTPQSSLGPLLDLRASSLRRGHANLLCIHSNFIGCSPKGIQQLLAKERNWGWKAHGPHFTLFYQLKALQVPNLQPSKPSIQTPSSWHSVITFLHCNLCKHPHLLLLQEIQVVFAISLLGWKLKSCIGILPQVSD